MAVKNSFQHQVFIVNDPQLDLYLPVLSYIIHNLRGKEIPFSFVADKVRYLKSSQNRNEQY